MLKYQSTRNGLTVLVAVSKCSSVAEEKYLAFAESLTLKYLRRVCLGLALMHEGSGQSPYIPWLTAQPEDSERVLEGAALEYEIYWSSAQASLVMFPSAFGWRWVEDRIAHCQMFVHLCQTFPRSSCCSQKIWYCGSRCTRHCRNL